MATEAETDFSQTMRALRGSAAAAPLEINVGGGTDNNARFGDRRTHDGGPGLLGIVHVPSAEVAPAQLMAGFVLLG